MKLNRRTLLSLIGLSPAVLAGTSARADNKKKKPAPVYGQEKVETLNPKGMPPSVQLIPMAPASYLKLGDETDIPVTRFVKRTRPGPAGGLPSGGIEIIVLGGETNTYWFGGDFGCVVSASVDKWR